MAFRIQSGIYLMRGLTSEFKDKDDPKLGPMSTYSMRVAHPKNDDMVWYMVLKIDNTDHDLCGMGMVSNKNYLEDHYEMTDLFLKEEDTKRIIGTLERLGFVFKK